jgi:competence protein ComEC
MRSFISIRKTVSGAALAALLLFIPCLGFALEGDDILKVTFLNIRQGDSTLIQTPDGKVILIDGGQSATRYSPFDAGKEVVLPYLEEEGIKKIDMVVATHPDYDHVGGLVEVVNSGIPIGVVYDTGIPHTTNVYNQLLDSIKARKMPLRVPEKGELLDWGTRVTARVLAPQVPPEKRMHESNLNEHSIVIRLEYGDVSFLLTGDCEHGCENIIMSSGARVKSTILKAGHHGSRTASGPDIYYLTDPEVVIISCGKRNKFDHPHWDPVQLFRESGAEIYRTDYHGHITVITDGKSYEVITGYASDSAEE